VRFAPLRLRDPAAQISASPTSCCCFRTTDPRRQNRFWLGADLALEVVSEDKPGETWSINAATTQRLASRNTDRQPGNGNDHGSSTSRRRIRRSRLLWARAIGAVGVAAGVLGCRYGCIQRGLILHATFKGMAMDVSSYLASRANVDNSWQEKSERSSFIQITLKTSCVLLRRKPRFFLAEGVAQHSPGSRQRTLGGGT